MGGFRSHEAHHGKIIVPIKPQVRTIMWRDRNTETITRERVVFPHSVFVLYYTRHYKPVDLDGNGNPLTDDYGNVRPRSTLPDYKYYLNRLCVGFSNTPFTGKDTDVLYGLPVGNLDSGYGVCFYNWPFSDDISDFCDQVISQYWSSPFVDYRDEFSHWINKYNGYAIASDGKFNVDWKAATARGDYDWILQQRLHGADFVVSLKQLFLSNKTLTDETDIMVQTNG